MLNLPIRLKIYCLHQILHKTVKNNNNIEKNEKWGGKSYIN